MQRSQQGGALGGSSTGRGPTLVVGRTARSEAQVAHVVAVAVAMAVGVGAAHAPMGTGGDRHGPVCVAGHAVAGGGMSKVGRGAVVDARRVRIGGRGGHEVRVRRVELVGKGVGVEGGWGQVVVGFVCGRGRYGMRQRGGRKFGHGLVRAVRGAAGEKKGTRRG